MYDKELALEILKQIKGAIEKIQKRFKPLKSHEEFTHSDYGMEKLDAICMQLIAIGESLKNIDKITNNALLARYDQVEWKKVKGLRDVISHHYFDVNAEAIFKICDKQLAPLLNAIDQIIEDIA